MQNRKENKGSLWCLLVRKRQCSRERVNTPLISPQSVTCFQINAFWVEFPHSVSKSRRNLKECFSALKVKGKKDNERLLEYTICMSLKENSSLLLHRSRFASSLSPGGSKSLLYLAKLCSPLCFSCGSCSTSKRKAHGSSEGLSVLPLSLPTHRDPFPSAQGEPEETIWYQPCLLSHHLRTRGFGSRLWALSCRGVEIIKVVNFSKICEVQELVGWHRCPQT